MDDNLVLIHHLDRPHIDPLHITGSAAPFLLLYQLLHMRYLWLLVLIVDVLARASSVMIYHKFVAPAVDFGNHLILLGGLWRRVVTAVAADGARGLICGLVVVHVVACFFV